MKKIETFWHYLLYTALHDGKFKHTQQALAEELHYSSSTIHHALRVPAQIGAVRKSSKFFVVEDVEKLLYYWASLRNLERDILYQTLIHAPVREMEGLIPPSCIFACYSAAKKLLGEAPADYAKVYFYAKGEALEEIKRRFPPHGKKEKTPPNLFVLKMPETMPSFGLITTLPQTFVDLWNLADWYSKDFTRRLRGKIDDLLSRPHH